MKTHKLKTTSAAYWAIEDDRKRFEFRKNDRGFDEGDILILCEWDEAGQAFTGAEIQVRVVYIVTGPDFGIPVGYACMSIRKLDEEACRRCGMRPQFSISHRTGCEAMEQPMPRRRH